jgi:nucleoside-diphosphate-sugar epimerase
VSGQVVILGGTGFLGRCLAERWPGGVSRPRFLVHRSEPAWLTADGHSVRHVDLSDGRSIADAVGGGDRLVNLLRPDGTLWLLRAMERLVPVLADTSISRIIHASSIDVYGDTPGMRVDEETAISPVTPYEREHGEIERIVGQASLARCIIRPGAIFGPGGQNLVKLASEIRGGRRWVLGMRRALYGRRRMHLVSVENVADAISMLATGNSALPDLLNVCDDADEANSFAFVQDALLRAFGRPPLRGWPHLPPAVLGAVLRARKGDGRRPARRFSDQRLRATGFRPAQTFVQRLERYASWLAHGERITS